MQVDLEEERQDDEILESPLDTKARNDREEVIRLREYTSTHQSLFSTDLHIRETTSYHSDQSFSKLEVASSYRSPQERAADLIHDHDGESKIPKELLIATKSDLSPVSSSPMRLGDNNNSPKGGILPKNQSALRLAPAMKKTASHDSYAKNCRRVSFSQDVEERML